MAAEQPGPACDAAALTSGPAPVPARTRSGLVLVLVLVPGLLLSAAAPARAEAPMRAVVRVPEAEPALWARVRGQSSDLDVTLTRVRDAGEPALADQLEVAARLARAHQARVVVWFRPLPGRRGVIVYVAEPGADTVFVRRLPQGKGSVAARSATAEAAALVVRSALRALAAGGRIGVASRQAVDEAMTETMTETRHSDRHAVRQPPGPSADAADAADDADAAADDDDEADDADDDDDEADADTPQVPVPPAPAAAARAASAAGASAPGQPVLWHLAVHWQAAVDGHSSAGHHGVAAHLGVGSRRWHVDAMVATHPAASSSDDLTTIRLTRHRLGLGIGRTWALGRGHGRDGDQGHGLAITAEVSAGVVVFARATEALSPEVMATAPGRVLSWAVSPGARLRVPVHRLAPGLFIEVLAAADVLLAVPELGYDRDGQFVARDRLYPVQPRIGLGLLLQSR